MRRYLLLFIFTLPLAGHAQPSPFTPDSIPVVDGEVVFDVDFDFDLSAAEFRKRAYTYLNDILDPYSGRFLLDNEDHMACRITDYIDIGSTLLQTFGLYMTYSLQLTYTDNSCKMVIRDVRFMEKRYFEAQEVSQRKLDMPTYTGADIMVDERYTLLTKKNASQEATEASLKRINEVVAGLAAAFDAREAAAEKAPSGN